MEEIEVMCTTVLATNTAFAVRADTGEQVFVPSAVAHAAQLQVGDIVRATVVPNTHYPEKTPWFAIRVERDAPVPALIAQDSLDQRIVEYLDVQPAYATTSEVAEEFNVDTTIAGNALNRVFRRGQAVRADVYSKPDQQRASFCLWAANTSRFVEVDL